jgi:hypothetical protein
MSDDTHLVMPRVSTKRMVASMECMAEAMLSVGVIDVSLIYGTAVQCEISRLEMLAAGLNEDGSERVP